MYEKGLKALDITHQFPWSLDTSFNRGSTVTFSFDGNFKILIQASERRTVNTAGKMTLKLGKRPSLRVLSFKIAKI